MKLNRAARRAKQRAWEMANPIRSGIWYEEAASIDQAMWSSSAFGVSMTARSSRAGQSGPWFDRGNGEGFTDKPLERGEWPRAMLYMAQPK
jgi:hypothetical protein